MQRTPTLLVGLFLSLFGATTSAQVGETGGLAGGGPLEFADRDGRNCISDVDALHAEQQLAVYFASAPALTLRDRATVFPYKFFPQSGAIYGDLFQNNYVDMQSGAGILDFECTNHTYNGHLGQDSDLRSFDEQTVGVPIFAVADGVVAATHDGEFDRQVTNNPSNPANYAILDHGGGHLTYYWHMRNGSVGVSVGQQVEAGQQIGLTGSSGNSSAPHLHFETRVNNVVIEPSSGACQTAPSEWAEPWSIRRDTYVREFQFVRGVLDQFYSAPPYEYPRDNHVTFGTSAVSYVVQGQNMPQGSVWRVNFVRPNGTVAYNSGNQTFGWATSDFRWWWSWWWFNISEMHSIAGEWRFQLFINNVLEVDAPVRVYSSEQGNANRPPYEVDVSIEPEEPQEGDVLICRVATDLVHDDPDYDVVRYTYRWFVNGVQRRLVTSAGHSDALPASRYSVGDQVDCEVTPSDGQDAGPTSTATIAGSGCRTVLPGDPVDLSGDQYIDGLDLAMLLAAWGTPVADINGDGTTDGADLAALLAAWSCQ